MLARIAWRNVLRHGKRTALTVATMTFGLGLFIAADSVLKGMDRMGLENIVDLTDSAVRISTEAYEAERRGAPLDYGIADPAAVEEFLRRDPQVLAATARIRFMGTLSNGTDGVPVLATAVDPVKDAAVFSLADYVRGSWLGAAEPEGPASLVLGSRLAEELGVGPGDWITLSARTRQEARNADDFLVAGIIDCPDPSVNNSGVFLSFDAAEEFLELEGLRTEMAVRMERRVNLKTAMADSDELAAAVNAAFPGLRAVGFGEIGRQFLELSKVKAKGSGVIILVMLVIAGVGIANTVLMSVYSRIREIGVLRAFGLSPRQISRLFILEGLMIGALGSLSGLAFGLILDALAIYIGLPMDAMLGDTDLGLPIRGMLRGEWNPQAMTQAVVFGLAVSLLASRFPAKRAARMEVTTALRFI